MSILKIFSIGKSDEKKQAKILGPNLSALFGAKEGESLEVEATESGLSAIDTAENQLTSIDNTVQESEKALNAANDKLKASETKVSNLQKQIKEQASEIERLGVMPAANHTTPKSGDVATGNEPAVKLSAYQKEAAERIDRAKGNSTTDKKD